MFPIGAPSRDGLPRWSRKPTRGRLDACDAAGGQCAQLPPPRAVHSGSAPETLMTQSKTSDELYNEQRRRHAAELIAALVRKRRRVTTDEALLDQEALRARQQ